MAVPDPLVIIPLCIQHGGHRAGTLCPRGIKHRKANRVLTVFLECRRVHAPCQPGSGIFDDRIRYLRAPVKPDLHFFIYLVHAAAADAVMGMVLHQDLPGILQPVLGTGPSFLQRQGRQGFCPAFQGHFVHPVEALKVNMCGTGIHQRIPSVGFLAGQFPLHRGKLRFHRFFYASDIILKIGMFKLDIRIKPAGRLDGRGKIFLHRLVVASVHEQKLARGSEHLRLFQPLVPVGFCFRLIHRDLHPVAVPVGKQDPKQRGTVRRFPHHLGIGGFILPALF